MLGSVDLQVSSHTFFCSEASDGQYCVHGPKTTQKLLVHPPLPLNTHQQLYVYNVGGNSIEATVERVLPNSIEATGEGVQPNGIEATGEEVHPNIFFRFR